MERLKNTVADLGHQFIDPMVNWYEGLDRQGVVLAVLLVVLVLAFRKSLTRAALRLLISTGKAIGLTVSEKVEETIKPAIQALIVSLCLLIALRSLRFPTVIDETLEKLLASVAIAAVFTAMYWLTDVVAKLLTPYRTSRTEIQLDWLIRLGKAIVGVLGAAAVLKVWDIDLGPALTGMGVLGAGVALAAQDLFRNLIAGFTNMSERRFQVGEWIKVEGIVEGIVERAEFRSTLIRRFDMAAVQVPNADLANSVMTNFSRMPHRRIYWKIGVVYSATEAQLEKIRDEIEKFIIESDDFLPPDEATCFVRVDSFGESSIDLLVYCFTKSPTYADFLDAKERLVLKIKNVVEHAGASFAFPSRSIYVEARPEAGPVKFEAAEKVSGAPKKGDPA